MSGLGLEDSCGLLAKATELHELARIARHDGPGFDVPGRDCARADDCAFADRHTGSDVSLGADPGHVTDRDRELLELASRALVVVAPAAQMSALRDGDLAADRDPPQV